MFEHAWMLEIILTVLTALIGGIGWLFKMLFTHNVNMTNKLIEIQESTTKTQVTTNQTLTSVKESLEKLKVCVDETNYYQKEIAHALKSQASVSTKNIVVSRSGSIDKHKRSHSHVDIKHIQSLSTQDEDISQQDTTPNGDHIQDRLANLKRAKA